MHDQQEDTYLEGNTGTGATGTAAVRRVWLGLGLLFLLVEAVLIAADLRLLGSPVWRPLAYQYGGFWAGLLYGWTPNYAAQPFVMFGSYMLLHAGWQHLVGNLLALAWLSDQLEQRLRWRAFLTLFVFSGLGGAVGFALLSDSPRPMVGASGAIMGLVAVWILADAQAMLNGGIARSRVHWMVIGRIALVVALNVLAWVLEAGALAWETHLGGFLAAALALALVPGLRPLPDRD